MSRKSELLDQSASESKSLVTTLLALPKLKLLASITKSYPRAIAFPTPVLLTVRLSPTKTLSLPVIKLQPASCPIQVFLPPSANLSPAPCPTQVLLAPLVTSFPASNPIKTQLSAEV